MLQLVVRCIRGDFAGVEKYFTTGLKFFDDPGFRQHPNGGAIVAFGTASWNAWMLGRADLARERMARLPTLVNQANPHDLPWADFHAAGLHILMRENEQAEALAKRALELCEERRFPNDAAYLRCFLGAARTQLGYAGDSIALIRQGISGLFEIGSRIGMTHLITRLAPALERAGALGDGLETIEQALQANPDELFYRPETLRLRGELRLKLGHTELAEVDFREAMALAQKLGAKAWELRATTSLTRLLAKQGRRNEARVMLAEIYGWFTDGLDTADLKDAKVLLDELSV
jgi:tetratricopeptide (TPR) repeat protein